MHIHISILFIILSHLVCYIILRFPCAIQQIFVGYPYEKQWWIHIISNFLTTPPPLHFPLKTISSYISREKHYLREYNGNPLQYSCLENPMDGGTWQAAILGVAQSRTRLKRLSCSSSNVHCSPLYNSQDMEATYMSVNRRMNKEDVVHTYSRIVSIILKIK